MRLMNEVLRPFAGKFVVVYFDDILIYSQSTVEHEIHLQKVCAKLQAEKLFANLSKCAFLRHSITFLGFVISTAGIAVDPGKTAAIRDWPTPTSPSEVRSFHGFAQFYHRFIWNFSLLAAPLTELLKATLFEWSTSADHAFQQIKIALLSALVLHLPDFDKLFDVVTYASGLDVGAVLSQELHPVSFFSEKLSEPKTKYSNYDRKLYAIVQALKFWRHYLLHQEFTLYSDHQALRFLHSQKKLCTTQTLGGNFAGLYLLSTTSTGPQKQGGRRSQLLLAHPLDITRRHCRVRSPSVGILGLPGFLRVLD